VDDETFGKKVERIVFIILAIIPASISYGMEWARRVLSKNK